MRLLRSRWFYFWVAIIGLPVAWYFWGTGWVAERKWQAYAEETRARGIKWTLAEYRPESVALERDLSSLPFFSAPEKWQSVLGKVPRFETKRTPDKDDFTIDWRAIRKSLKENGVKVNPTLTDDLQACDDAMAYFSGAVDLLTNSRADAGNWAAWWEAKDYMASPYAGEVVSLTGLLAVQARIDLELNRPERALKSLEALIRLSRASRMAPTMLMYAVSRGATKVGWEVVIDGIESGAWPDEALRRFASEYFDSNPMCDFEWSMATERAFVRETLEGSIGDSDWVMGKGWATGSAEQVWQQVAGRIRASRRSYWRENQLWLERSRDELLLMMDGRGGRWKPRPRIFDPERAYFEDPGQLGPSLAIPDIVWVKRSVFTFAQNKMMALACALELWRRSRGSYPSQLEDLVGEFLPALPLDPVSGRSFIYRAKDDDTYLLYSVGFDGIDDGGDSLRRRRMDEDEKDWRRWAPRLNANSSK